MKAVRIHQFGGPEVLTYEDVPDPKPRKDQVLIRVRACSLNHLDLFVRKGLPGVNLPHILGSDIAGEIVEVGEYITDLKPGQRVLLAPMHFCNHCAKCVAGLQNQCRQYTVLGNTVDGGNCELIAVPAVNVIPIPDSLDFPGHGRNLPSATSVQPLPAPVRRPVRPTMMRPIPFLSTSNLEALSGTNPLQLPGPTSPG